MFCNIFLNMSELEYLLLLKFLLLLFIFRIDDTKIIADAYIFFGALNVKILPIPRKTLSNPIVNIIHARATENTILKDNDILSNHSLIIHEKHICR